MSPFAAMALILIFFFFFFLPTDINAVFHSFKTIQLPSLGSEAYAFDSENRGPYTALNDGRIVKYHQGPTTGFLDFATTSRNRSRSLCDGKNGDDPKTGPLCGRPIGLEFNHKTGELYLVDAFFGLMVVGSGGGVAAPLAGGRDGAPRDAPDALAIDPVTGAVYFTDVGSIFFKTKY